MSTVAGLVRHPWLRHLRLPFNLMLAPIYLYGATTGAASAGVARPLADPAFWIAFASLHLFLYGGTTAFNSYYDRDEGPIGGMLAPPAVDAGLLPFSLIVQAIGLALALAVGGWFVVAWIVLFLLFTAYSHPAVRLKAHPVAAIAAIALGQGAVGFAAGWLVFASVGDLLTLGPLVRMALTASIVTGLYVVTQSYQADEDRARGDRTLPVLLGPSRALRLAVVILMPGGVALVADLARWAGPFVAATAAVVLAGVAVAIWRWASEIVSASTEANFRRAMGIVSVASGTTAGLLVWALAARAGSG